MSLHEQFWNISQQHNILFCFVSHDSYRDTEDDEQSKLKEVDVRALCELVVSPVREIGAAAGEFVYAYYMEDIVASTGGVHI